MLTASTQPLEVECESTDVRYGAGSGDTGLDLATQLRQKDHKLETCLSRVSSRSAWATYGI